jgi:hypothetical protein
MSTKSEISDGLRAVVMRFERLAPDIDAYLAAPLPTGFWTVHDCVCHLAADSHAVDGWRERIDNLIAGRGARPPGFDINDYNAANIAARKDKPLAEVLDEVRDAFAGDLAAIDGLEEDLLAREVPYRGGIAPAAEMLRFYTGAHNLIHLDDIEQALALAGAPGASAKMGVLGGLRRVNERFEQAGERLIAGAETALLSGSWTVRDALCHLAARSNGVPTFITRVERLAQGLPMSAPGGLNIDDVNQSQIDARAGRPAAELLHEITEGHRAAIQATSQLDDAVFEREVKDPRAEALIPAAHLLLRGTVNHDNAHLDEIEAALEVRP